MKTALIILAIAAVIVGAIWFAKKCVERTGILIEAERRGEI